MTVNLADTEINHSRLGETLVRQGITTPDQIAIALHEQKKNGEKFGDVLVRLGFTTESIIRDVMGGIAGRQSANLENVIADSEAVAMVPQHIARRYQVIPLNFDQDNRTLTVAMADTCNVIALDQITHHAGRGVSIVTLLAGAGEIEKTIDRYYGFELSIDGILNEIETDEIDYQSLDTDNQEYSHPIVRLVNALLVDAIKRAASDIHLEPEQWYSRFRYRIDGVLRQIRSIHRKYWPAIAVRIKVMAGMDIAETRAPQDGRFSLSISGRIVDFRASTFPTLHGENIVLRVLDRQRCIVSLEHLDLREDEAGLLRTMAMKPAGIVLVTGPTGSGKTTTLYAILNYLNTESVHIMTLEDPVEYPSTLIRQTSVGPGLRLDFASGLRSLMRQDPDIILVGEVRDEDTAQLALRAAMTGHKVFTTLHTNSALGAIPRLFDLDVQPDMLAGNIIGVIAQRLVRRLCHQCKEAQTMTGKECALLNIEAHGNQQVIYRAKGCTCCTGTGYQGRLAIMEALCFDAAIDEIIARRGARHDLLRHAVAKGFRTLVQAGIARIVDGLTTIDEVARVVDLAHGITGTSDHACLPISGH